MKHRRNEHVSFLSCHGVSFRDQFLTCRMAVIPFYCRLINLRMSPRLLDRQHDPSKRRELFAQKTESSRHRECWVKCKNLAVGQLYATASNEKRWDDSVSGTAYRPSGTGWSLTHCSWQSERYRLTCRSFRHRATGPAVWVPTTGVAREVASWEAVLKPPPVHTTLPVPRCPVHRVKHLTWAWAGFLPGEFYPLWRVSPAASDMHHETGEMLQRGLTRAEVARW